MEGRRHVVVGIVGFTLDPERHPRPAPLAEEDLLFKRVRRRLAESAPAGLGAERFAEWWRAPRRGRVA